ncbi:MAG: DUF4364 family protein [Clostridia bacterium]|nr:DUF4364 family protein [Clostridia bacterium]
MDFKLDAFPVDDTVGGIRSTEKIKIIICYILENTKGELTRSAVQSALYDNGIANYFEISQAVDDLIKVGAVEQTGAAQDPVLSVSEKGIQIANDLEDELSVYIRNKAVKAANLTAVHERRMKENDVVITKINDKRYRLDITLHSGLDNDGSDDELMKLSVFVTDQFQAQTMKQSFINNPVKLYEKVIEGLTDDPVFKE